jgi:hypothetical protein
LRWLRELWREIVADWNRPLDWADYAATKDWDLAEKLWRDERDLGDPGRSSDVYGQ